MPPSPTGVAALPTALPSALPTALPTALDRGRVLRLATEADHDAVVALAAAEFGAHDAAPVRAYLGSGLGAEWLVVVEGPDAAQPGGGRLVAASGRIPHPVRLDGHPVPASQIEYVVTAPQARRQGLVRAQLAAHHARADATGELAQFISGIPYLYRKLGYDYALDQPEAFLFDPARVRALAAATPASVTCRPADPGDHRWLRESGLDRPTRGLRIAWDEPTWDAWLAMVEVHPGDPVGPFGRARGTCDALEVVERAGRPVGWVKAHLHDEGGELYPLAAWVEDTDAGLALLAHLHDLADVAAASLGRPVVVVGAGSPDTRWDTVLATAGTGQRLPTGMYARVSDPGALLRGVAPVLGERLAASPFGVGHHRLRLSLYDHGLELRWHDGVVTAVDRVPGDPDPFSSGAVGVAPDRVGALVFGRWGAAGLAGRADDVMLGRHREVMEVLFPRRPNDIGTNF